jgi:preprotein translocase subunit SecE
MKTATMDNGKELRESPSTGGALAKPAHWWERLRVFLLDVRSEMRRVTWPSRAEVYATTIVVVLTSVFFGVYLWGLDLLLDAAARWIYRTLGAA